MSCRSRVPNLESGEVVGSGVLTRRAAGDRRNREVDLRPRPWCCVVRLIGGSVKLICPRSWRSNRPAPATPLAQRTPRSSVGSRVPSNSRERTATLPLAGAVPHLSLPIRQAFPMEHIKEIHSVRCACGASVTPPLGTWETPCVSTRCPTCSEIEWTFTYEPESRRCVAALVRLPARAAG